MTKGFITVATGSHYCWLAENLLMSYKVFSKCDIPMYVITDKKGEKRLKKCFDGVIVLENPEYNFMDKMVVYEKSPFDQTIFLDADMNIVRDISYLFDDFEKNESDVSCIGVLKDITPETRPIHFGDGVVNRYHLKRFNVFGGGVYYYKRGPVTDNVFKVIFDELVPNFDELNLNRQRNSMTDEALIDAAMSICNLKPLDSPKDIMKYHARMMSSIKWDLEQKKCSFIWWENILVAPDIVHYGTDNTFHKKYVYYNSLVRCRYKKIIKPWTAFVVAFHECKLFCQHLTRKSDRSAFRYWVKAHFTREHLEYRKSQIKSKFGK